MESGRDRLLHCAGLSRDADGGCDQCDHAGHGHGQYADVQLSGPSNADQNRNAVRQQRRGSPDAVLSTGSGRREKDKTRSRRGNEVDFAALHVGGYAGRRAFR